MTTACLRRVDELAGAVVRTPIESLTPIDSCTREEDMSQIAVPAETGFVKIIEITHFPGGIFGVVITAAVSDAITHDTDSTPHTVALH